MEVDSLDLPEQVKQRWIDEGIEELNPPQEEAIERGVLDGRNMVVSSPTASGKTLIAEMAFLQTILERGKKALYIVPLRALASEKYQDFQQYESLGMEVSMAVGDRDSAEDWLGNSDLIIATSEKLDSILRHQPDWIRDVDLVVTDEIHLLNDESRGPTLEVVLTRLLEMDPQILGLSATIANSEELAGWLNAEHIHSDYRPVELYQGVFDGQAVRFEDSTRDFELGDDRPATEITRETLDRDKQLILFAASRRNAESIADKARTAVAENLTGEEEERLEELADAVLSVPSRPTPQCRKLARCVRSGTAFHHAGLANGQREIIEDAFRDHVLKAVSATPTLAAGIDMPAYRVVVRDVKRYHPTYGSVFIPVLEYHQMAGRAGRPGYDDEGEAVLVAKNQEGAREMVEKYVEGDPEEIHSKLSVEPVLRMHILALIATHVSSEEELREFLEKTFFAHQFQDMEKVRDKVGKILRRLRDQEFVEVEGEEDEPKSLDATRTGERVAQLYLDPETAHYIITNLSACSSTFELLVLVSNTSEMYSFRVKKSEEEDMMARMEKRGMEESLAPAPWDMDYEGFLEAFKTALVLEAWTEEWDEDEIYEEFGASPGGVRSRVEIAQWLLYASQELALLMDRKEKSGEARKARMRVQHGVKEDLLSLVSLRGIGRVRARRLDEAGYGSIGALKDASPEELSDILGPKIGEKVYKQVHTKEELQEKQTKLG